MVALLFIGLNANASDLHKKIDPIKVEVQLVPIDIHLTSKDGCEFHILGEYSYWGGGFTGTVTASGSGDCPNGTWTFGLVINDDGNGPGNVGGRGYGMKIVGNNPFIFALKQDHKMRKGLVDKIRANQP